MIRRTNKKKVIQEFGLRTFKKDVVAYDMSCF